MVTDQWKILPAAKQHIQITRKHVVIQFQSEMIPYFRGVFRREISFLIDFSGEFCPDDVNSRQTLRLIEPFAGKRDLPVAGTKHGI